MTKTRTDLGNEALAKLGVFTPGNAPAAEDREYIDLCIDSTVARINAENVYSIISTDEFDDAIFAQLALCVAVTAGAAFGQPAGDDAWKAATAPLWRLARINRGTGKLLDTDASLRATGRILPVW